MFVGVDVLGEADTGLVLVRAVDGSGWSSKLVSSTKRASVVKGVF